MVIYGDLVSRKEELRIREFGDFLTSVQMACVQRFSAMSEVNINIDKYRRYQVLSNRGWRPPLDFLLHKKLQEEGACQGSTSNLWNLVGDRPNHTYGGHNKLLLNNKQYWLVAWNMLYFPQLIYGIILPIDYIIFFQDG